MRETPPSLPDIRPVTLQGRRVRLVPLHADQRDDLAAAVGDGEVWQLWYTSVPEPMAMAGEIEHRLRLQALGTMLPFTVIHQPDGNATGEVVGMTTYMNIDRVNRRVEIGSTWYARRAQATGLNTEAKLLLLAHAFDDLGCIAVEFRTHFLNHQSRRAIERLGARLDGILRNHQRTRNGALRDTCVYSILPSEWPTVRAHLEWQLEKPRS